MRITISWVNRNAFAEGHRVYRSTTPIDTNALPAPLATLAAAASMYHDRDVVRGETYYYRIGTYKGSEMVFTANMQAIALPNTGPGPSGIAHGDFNSGFFGVVEAHQLVSGPELKTILGHTLPAGSASQQWAKVAHKGKILFVPIGLAFGATTWQQVYSQGLVYGTDDDGPEAAITANGGIGVNQLKTFTKDNFTYKVRCLNGLPDNGIFNWAGTESTDPDLEGSEYNQVALRLAYGAYGNQLGSSVTGLTSTAIHGNSEVQSGTLCQGIVANSAVMRSMRRRQYYRWSDGHNYTVYFDMPGGAITMPFGSASRAGFGGSVHANWRPVLELVPPAPVVEPEPGGDPDGAGSTMLTAGDVQLGFYESLPVTSLVTGTELAALVGLTAGDPIAANDDVNWIKYSFEGKTRYVAQKPIRNNLSADELIAAGVADEVGKTVIIGDSTYRVTLMEGANPVLTEYEGVGHDTNSTHNSEWNQVMYRLYSGDDVTASEEPYENWLTLSNAELDTTYYCFTLGKVFGRPANTIIARGYGSVSHIASLLNESKVAANAWRPVLELVTE